MYIFFRDKILYRIKFSIGTKFAQGEQGSKFMLHWQLHCTYILYVYTCIMYFIFNYNGTNVRLLLACLRTHIVMMNLTSYLLLRFVV